MTGVARQVLTSVMSLYIYCIIVDTQVLAMLAVIKHVIMIVYMAPAHIIILQVSYNYFFNLQ